MATPPADARSADAAYLRRGAVTLVAGAAAGYGVTYGLNVALTRLLSPHSYGDFRVAFAFASLAGVAVLLGGDRAAPAMLGGILEPGGPRRAGAYLRFYLGIGLALSAAVFAVVWAGSWLHLGTPDPQHHHPLAWVAGAVPILAAGALAGRALQSARWTALASLPWRVGMPALHLALCLAVLGVAGRLTLGWVIATAVVAAAVVSGGQWLALWRLRLVARGGDAPRAERRRWLATSLPMMGAFLVALGLDQSDLYFLEALGDEHDVGHYAAAATTAHLLIVVQTTLVSLVAPLVRPALDAGSTASRAAYRRAWGWMAAAVVPLGAALALAGRPVLALFGPGYADHAGVLALLVLGNLAWALAALAVLWLQYRGDGAVVLAIATATLVVDSVLNLVLIPRYGPAGAAASTALTMSLASAAVVVALARRC